jgi:hypothetical protein
LIASPHKPPELQFREMSASDWYGPVLDHAPDALPGSPGHRAINVTEEA